METFWLAGVLAPVAALGMLTIANTGCAVIARFQRRCLVANQPLTMLLVLTVGCLVVAFAGLVIALAPIGKRYIAWALLLGLNAGCGYLNWKNRKTLPVHRRAGSRYFGVWGATTVGCLLFAFAPTKPPAQFFDGPYVYKKWVEFVRIQRLAGDYPADNVIPAFVAEYIVRNIPFAAERPIAPGQEVANRPILMSLVYVPFRAALGEQSQTLYPLPRFHYVGTSWPDASSNVTDFNFRQFLAIGIVLNGLAVVAFLALLETLGVRYPWTTAVLVALTSIYVIVQTVFTWPKNFAAFFIIAAWLVLHERRSVLLAAALMAGAYWAHPYALAFAAAAGLFILLRSMSEARHDAGSFKAPLLYAAVFGLLVAPWFAWTKLYLGIEGDLVAQNLWREGTLFAHAWVRVVSLAKLWFPEPLLVFPFDPAGFVRGWGVTLMSTMGFLVLFAPTAVLVAPVRDRELAVYGALLPGFLIVLAFSYAAVPMLHGWQAAWMILAAVTLSRLQEWTSRRGLVLLITAQAAINLVIVGAHLSYYSE